MKKFDIRAYAEEKLERFRPSAGHEVTGICPSCKRYGGFYVNTESGAFLCNKCDLRGCNIAGLISVIESISEIEARAWVFRQSVQLRRKETVITLQERLQALRPHVIGAESIAMPIVDDTLPREFRACYAHKAGRDVWQLPEYLKKRRIKSATAKSWGLGFVSFDAPHSRECLEDDGDKCLPDCSYRYRGRLVIPFDCPNGRSFTARDMKGDKIPKYLNPTGTDFRRLIIGWNVARLTGDIVICEGPLDAMALYQHSLSALSLGGKELHDEQLSMLMSLPTTTNMIIMLDPDEMEAPLKVALRLSVHFVNIYISKLLPLDGVSIRGLDSNGNPNKLDPGNCTPIEAYEAVDNAERWTGGRAANLRAKLEKLRQARAYRWG